MSELLKGKHAVITGGGRGIGAAIAGALAGHGATLSLMGRDTNRLSEQAARLRVFTQVQAIAVDVTDPASVQRAFAEARASFATVHILVNNAGGAESAPFGKTDLNLWNKMLSVNLTGVYLCCHEVVPEMLAQVYGRIVNIASIAGLTGHPYTTAYCAAKHGVVGLTRALALETARKNVTVNAICPGYTETDMMKGAVQNIMAKTGHGERDARAALAQYNPLGRLIQPQEVANAVAWLCLPGSEAINGQAIQIA